MSKNFKSSIIIPLACLFVSAYIAGLVSLIIERPLHDDPFKFQIESLMVNPIITSSNNGTLMVSDHLNLTLSMKNAVPIKLESLQVSVAYAGDDSMVSLTELEFDYRQEKVDQVKKMEMGMVFNASGSNIYKDLLSMDELKFNVNVLGPFWTNWGKPLTLHECDMQIVCEDIKVTLEHYYSYNLTLGYMIGRPKHCKYSSTDC